MMNGDQYVRTLNEYATRYFLEHIRMDFGDAVFTKAIEACKKHVQYYAGLDKGKLRYVERIIKELDAYSCRIRTTFLKHADSVPEISGQSS